MVLLNDKQAQINWDKFRESIMKGTPVDLSESAAEQVARVKHLEANPEEWKKYYFNKFFKYDSPAFHSRASRRLLTNFLKKRHWYEVRHWARGLSKSTVTMMDVLYLVFTGKLKNIILTSSTWDAASEFLEKYRAQLDSNQRLINDYGKQEMAGSWSKGCFYTRNGCKFIACGKGQTPRGNGNEEIRPDCIIVDDFDTDQDCRNADIINQDWDWFEKALFFTVDTAEPYLIIWLGNIIAPDCCVVRAGQMADHCETINIRDDDGVSVWPQKNSEEDIDYQIAHVSWAASQQELFNNPVRPGQTFKEIKWGKCPPLTELRFVLAYADPATSNKDKPSLKSKAQNSCKSVVLVGKKGFNYYLYTCWLDHMTNAAFVDCMYESDIYVNQRTAMFCYLENNTLQDPFYQQILMPLVYKKGQELKKLLSVSPDARKKPEKFFRIESTLEPLVRLGHLIFNEDEKNNPHMKRMEAQFIAASPNSKTMDGPDAVEGAVFKIREKELSIIDGGMKATGRKRSSSKHF